MGWPTGPPPSWASGRRKCTNDNEIRFRSDRRRPRGWHVKADVDSLESNDFVEEFLEQHPDAPDEAVELAYQMGEMTKTIEQREEEKREDRRKAVGSESKLESKMMENVSRRIEETAATAGRCIERWSEILEIGDAQRN